jgi:hypothetical protein
MFKQFMLAMTFLATFGIVGVGVTEKAEAWRRWGRPSVSYYHGPPRAYHYGGYVPYRSYYGDYYGPRYYRSYYGGYSDRYYYGPRRGVGISIGF